MMKPVKISKVAPEYREFEDDMTDDELREYAMSTALDDYAFSRLTGADLSDANDLFSVAREGVELAPVDDHALMLISESHRMQIREAGRHRLRFPCTPAELVAFVDKVDWYFELPEVFREMVAEADGNGKADNITTEESTISPQEYRRQVFEYARVNGTKKSALHFKISERRVRELKSEHKSAALAPISLIDQAVAMNKK